MTHSIASSETTLSSLRSLEMVRPPLRARFLAKAVLGAIVLAILAMLFLPWQQTSRGTGQIVAYHPTERPQTVEAPVYGRVVRWGENIVEGARVTKGQVILEIADNDPERAERLAEQVAAAEAKLKFAQEKAKSYADQVREYESARSMVIESGNQLVAMAGQKVEASRRDLEAAEAAKWQLELDNERQASLAKVGVVAELKAQEAKAKFDQATAKLKAATNYIAAADNEQKSKAADVETKTREANAKIQYAQAMHQQAQGDIAIAQKELSEIGGKAAQFGRRAVEAPRDGVLFRLYVSDNAQMLKEGDPLFTVVPATTSPAAEIWVDGNDVPLVALGREVRLQFEGWPAVQFAGWPSVAVGTFGGTVVAIDATDDGKGKFRVLVRPEHESDWPSERFLRQGARANGWVMLNQVTLGYELWRQLNGFPQVISPKEPKSDDKTGGKEKVKIKLPK